MTKCKYTKKERIMKNDIKEVYSRHKTMEIFQ